jgi:hypothetical protein
MSADAQIISSRFLAALPARPLAQAPGQTARSAAGTGLLQMLLGLGGVIAAWSAACGCSSASDGRAAPARAMMRVVAAPRSADASAS